MSSLENKKVTQESLLSDRINRLDDTSRGVVASILNILSDRIETTFDRVERESEIYDIEYRIETQVTVSEFRDAIGIPETVSDYDPKTRTVTIRP